MAPRHRRSFLGLLTAAAVVAAACSSTPEVESADDGGEAATTSPVTGSEPTPSTVEVEPVDEATAEEVTTIDAAPGVLVWVHDAEPPSLHADDPENPADVAAWLQQGLLEGLFGIGVDNEHYPELLAGEPAVSQLNSGTVVIEYRLRDGLTWSDGTPLTSADVAYTHDILVEGCEVENDRSIVDATVVGCEYDLAARFGYELITDFEVVSDTEFTVTMAAFYGGWRTLYDRVFAAHAFGESARDVNDNLRQWSGPQGVLPSSGPLVFDRWEPGVAIHLAANDRYHGSASPDATTTGPPSIAGVQLAFVGDTATQIELLLAGDAHIIMARPEPALAELTASDSFTVASAIGPLYEHWGLNLLDEHLAKPEVREAIAYAIDKQEVVAQIYQPVYGDLLPAEGLGSSFWVPGQRSYEDSQRVYAGNNVGAAAAALEAAGYVRQSGGGWRHPIDGALQLRAGTTAGVQLRDEQLALVAEQLGRAGIEVVIDSDPGGFFFTDGPFSEEALVASMSQGSEGDTDRWDIAQFSWTGGPWPGAISGIYRSGSRSNPYGFASPEYDVAATDCDAIVDDAERAACYTVLDRFATALDEDGDGLFVIPLTQTPRYFGYSSPVTAAGAAPDVIQGGPLVNAADYLLG